jgi:hypothetical protein
MSLWQDLLTTAVVGSERRPPTLPAAGDAVGDLLSGLDRSDAEGTLLGAVAALSVYRRAGRSPEPMAQPLPEPCVPDDLPACSPVAGRHLAVILSGERRDVLPEWLNALAAAGKRVIDERLPDLLDLGWRDAALRPAIEAVLGARGRWLAALNPDWGYARPISGRASEGPDDSTWETGDRAARLSLLQSLRGRDPAWARGLLKSTWSEETHADRAAFLSTFEVGLTMDDEPFLEEALGGTRKEVRSVASDLLARLPESRLCQRMAERLRPLLSFEAARKRLGLTRGPRIEVTLPEACDKDMRRDGIEPTPRGGVGQKAWWLMQMIAAVPPALWTATWGATPAELIAAAARNEWKAVLLEGWRLAALRHRDADWASALLSARLDKSPDLDVHGLIPLLPTSDREAFALRALDAPAGARRGEHLGLLTLLECRHPWSAQLTRAVLNRVRRDAASAAGQLLWPLRELALYMTPSLVNEAAGALSPQPAADSSAWGRKVADCLALLQFRHDMLEEIAR